MFFGLIKNPPIVEVCDLMLSMRLHPERFAETELIKQYTEAGNREGLMRLASEEYRRRKDGKSHHSVKENKLLTAKVSEAAIALTDVTKVLTEMNKELAKAKQNLKVEQTKFQEAKMEYKIELAKKDAEIQKKTDEVTKTSEMHKRLVTVLFNSATDEAKRNYGIGYNIAFKSHVWNELAKLEPKLHTDSIKREQAFEHLYNIIDLYTQGKFFDEFEHQFMPKVKKSGVKAPGVPRYDWNKLDMISSNEMWQAIADVALADFNMWKGLI